MGANGRARIRYYLARFGVLFGALLVAGVAAEIGIRLFFPQVFPPHPPGLYVEDPVVGFVLTPGFEGRHQRPEFSTEVVTNRAGLRGPELEPRDPGVLRVLCVGDSFTWGWGVKGDEAYPARLQAILAERFPSRDVQVLNAGVPGYGNDEELEWLRTRGAELEPDLVVVQFFPWNDFDDNLAPARTTHRVEDGMLRQDPPDGDGGRPAWLRSLDRLKRGSHLLFMTSERAGYIAMRMGLLRDLEETSAEHYSEELGRLTSDLLADLGRTASELGARSLFVFVPEKQRIVAVKDSDGRATEVIARAAKEVGAAWVDLAPVFREHPRRFELYYQGDAHWTPLGSDVAAQAIAERIVSLRLLETGPGLTARGVERPPG